MLREFFVNLKAKSEYLNYGRPIFTEWGRAAVAGSESKKPFSVLDLGCGHGTDLLNIQAATEKKLKLYGIENYPPYVAECRQQGIEIASLDIEKDAYPYAEQSFDLILANQILEHTKEIFWIMAECARLLKPGGKMIVGVPNLASFHNRLLLLFGQQPTAQQSLSAHVRTFTRADFKRFAEEGNFFRLLAHRGSNFYPFPPVIARPLARIFPGMAWGAFFYLERTDRPGSFLECLEKEVLETPYYGSPQNPAKKAKSVKKSAKRQKKSLK